MAAESIFLVRSDLQKQYKLGRKLGIDDAIVAKVILDEIHRVGVVCRDALQTGAPVETRELRQSIDVHPPYPSIGRPEVNVRINTEVHQSSRTKRKLTNAELADVLDIGVHQTGVLFKRRMNSVPENTFAPYTVRQRTKNWIGQAQTRVNQRLKAAE